MKKRNQDNKKKFKLFDPYRDGKGVYEAESRKPTLKFFFVLLWRKLSQLFQLNLLMLVKIIPLLVIAGIYLLGSKTPIVTDSIYIPLSGVGKILPTASLTTELDLASVHMQYPVLNTWMNVLIIVMVLFLALTWGWQSVGATYVLRGLFRGDAVFVFSDFFYAIKKNFKQAFFMGLLDFIISAVLIIDFIFFYYRTGTSFGIDMMYFMIFLMGIIYIMMRFYLYHLLITFELKNFKIVKNAFIFSILGIKRNIMALLGFVLLLALHIFLIIIFIPIGISIPIVLPFVYILAIFGFISTYAAYPIIDRYMIQPYEASQKANSAETNEEENKEITE
ncbi:MAG: DUF624 domain-containing protein [Clostridia bacterium]|nr:DUF624 domain-containing protein [Clostridia bacterium]